jgi:sugar phosphate isomerase/epimerase
MNIALSNLAWKHENRKSMFDFLCLHGIDKIECVFTKIKPWQELTEREIKKFKKELDNHSIKAYSVQSIFYNIDCSISETDFVIIHFKKLLQYSKILGIKVIVFGSPNLRKRFDGWEASVVKIFTEIDKLIQYSNSNIIVAIEPNARIYGGEFWYTVEEISEFIKNNNLKNIKTMVDTHNVFLEKQDPILVLEKYIEHIAHIHVSEEKLKPMEDIQFNVNFSKKIKELKFDGTVTYEVLESSDIFQTVEQFVKIYK